MKYLRLKNQSGAFVDAETGLNLCRDDVVPYIPPVGRLTKRWLNGGGLQIFEGPAELVQEEPAKFDVIPLPPPDDELGYQFYSEAELNAMPFFTLKKAATALGMKTNRTDIKAQIVKQLLAHQEELKAQL